MPQGGSGQALDWEQLQAPHGQSSRGWLLAGGLKPDNVRKAVTLLQPTAVDVSSGVCGPDGRYGGGSYAAPAGPVVSCDASGLVAPCRPLLPLMSFRPLLLLLLLHPPAGLKKDASLVRDFISEVRAAVHLAGA